MDNTNYLISYNEETTTINENTTHVDLEHCVNCFEVETINNNLYKITKILKNTFGKFQVYDIIETGPGMITIQNIVSTECDINSLIFFERNKINFFCQKIDDNIEKIKNEINDFINSSEIIKCDKYKKLLKILQEYDDEI